MPSSFSTEASRLLASSEFKQAKDALIAAIQKASGKFTGVKPSTPEAAERYKALLQSFQKNRGRDLYFPFLSSGLGRGCLVELEDGSVKYDLITGIGINFFGHSNPEYLSEMIDALPSDVMQGNLQPGIEATAVIGELLKHVGSRSRLTHAWLMCSGTMVNEVALKIIRQRRTPATKVLAFKDAFAGRSTAMQEITDNPGYRVGQPVYGEVEYLSFYDPKLGLEKSLEQTLGQMKEHLARFPGRFAALMMELVQGEGGFQSAPREFYVKIFEQARAAQLAVWIDEIQTFGRTGELFAYQTFGLDEFIDVVTIGKLSQACAVLYTPEYNPKPGLVAGTFSGSSVALRTARRTLEMLTAPGVQGPEGRVLRLSRYFEAGIKKLAQGSCKGMISDVRAIGGMIGFIPFDGKQETVKQLLHALFEAGVVAFYCGHGPFLIRMLPPLMIMEEREIDAVLGILESTMLAVDKKRGPA